MRKWVALAAWVMAISAISAQETLRSELPGGLLAFGAFTTEFNSDGTISVEGEGWPTFAGTWNVTDGLLRLATSECDAPGRYRFEPRGAGVRLELVDDACEPRRMILDRSEWRPASEERRVPERVLSLRQVEDVEPLPNAPSAKGSWPSFRGPQASGVADGQHLPDRWNGSTGRNVSWKTPIPGLAHSSPVVWGDRIFVTTAVSSRGGASFRRGLYGDGDASEDRSTHQWTLYALDRSTGEDLWERVAREGIPAGKRHVKSTYASATPAPPPSLRTGRSTSRTKTAT